jgi:hypothetical protein
VRTGGLPLKQEIIRQKHLLCVLQTQQNRQERSANWREGRIQSLAAGCLWRLVDISGYVFFFFWLRREGRADLCRRVRAEFQKRVRDWLCRRGAAFQLFDALPKRLWNEAIARQNKKQSRPTM